MKIICPSCRKTVDWVDNEFRPFCSERCRLIELGSWAKEVYKLKGEESGGTENYKLDNDDTEKLN